MSMPIIVPEPWQEQRIGRENRVAAIASRRGPRLGASRMGRAWAPIHGLHQLASSRVFAQPRRHREQFAREPTSSASGHHIARFDGPRDSMGPELEPQGRAQKCHDEHRAHPPCVPRAAQQQDAAEGDAREQLQGDPTREQRVAPPHLVLDIRDGSVHLASIPCAPHGAMPTAPSNDSSSAISSPEASPVGRAGP
jgi:hypothetical protein